MVKYNLDELHRRMLGILKVIDSVCQKHELRYYITAGTMLGAIRHKGFIPWDDDADICMPRPDYEKLIAHCQEWLPQPFELVSAETDAVYPLPFAKIQDGSTTLIERIHLKYLGGIYVDVFPIDGVPENRLLQKLHFARYEYYKRILYLMIRDPYKHGHGPDSWIPLLCRKFYKLADVQSRIRRLLLKYNYEGSRYVADYDDGLRGVMPKSVLGLPTPYEFEGEQVRGVEQYDTYLSQKYGDYMTIPPHSEQRQHSFYYLDLGKSYREYKSV